MSVVDPAAFAGAAAAEEAQAKPKPQKTKAPRTDAPTSWRSRGFGIASDCYVARPALQRRPKTKKHFRKCRFLETTTARRVFVTWPLGGPLAKPFRWVVPETIHGRKSPILAVRRAAHRFVLTSTLGPAAELDAWAVRLCGPLWRSRWILLRKGVFLRPAQVGVCGVGRVPPGRIGPTIAVLVSPPNRRIGCDPAC